MKCTNPANDNPKAHSNNTFPHRILLVDDDEQVLHLIERILGKEPFELNAVKTVAEAESLLDQGERYDILVTDLNLPHKDGLEMLRIARELDPLMARVIVTGYARHHTEESLQSLGAFSVITKPFHPHSFRETLRQALEERAAWLAEPC